jgi:hypothetical protein
MANYYAFIDTIKAGWPANANDINAMQLSNEMAFDTSITDLDGDAFVLGVSEDAFKLTPAESISLQPNTTGGSPYFIDQANDWGGQISPLNYYSIDTMDISQQINILKSSIQNIYIVVSNTGTTDGIITFSIKQPDLTGEEGIVYGSVTLTIPAGKVYTPLTPLQINFAIDHLPAGEYELEIVNKSSIGTTGIGILYDPDAHYIPGGGLLESPDGINWDETGYDLWFVDEYATSSTFDLNGDIAVLRGNIVPNLDTHITMTGASTFGDRLDLVCLTPLGTLEDIVGDISKYPILPSDKPPLGYLPIASVYVQQNQSTASSMIVNQDDSQAEFRQRTQNERLRRLEKWQAWSSVKDIPQRIKYTLSGSEIIGGDSVNVIWDDTAITPGIITPGAAVLSDSTSESYTWTLKDKVNIGTLSNIDLSDTTNGIAKLTTKDGTFNESTYYTSLNYGTYEGGKATTFGWDDLTHQSNNSGTYNVSPCIYPDNSQHSTYPCIYEYIQEAGYLTNITAWIVNFRNINNVYANVYKMASSDRHSALTFIEKSKPFAVTGNTHIGHDEGVEGGLWNQTNTNTSCDFSGDSWVTPGWYVFVFSVDPIKHSIPAQFLIGTFNTDGMFNGKADYKQYTEFGEFTGTYPLKNITEGSMNSSFTKTSIDAMGLTALRSLGSCSITHQVSLETSNYLSSGIFYSSIITASADISKVFIDVNQILPTGTGYKVEVTNNGGTNWVTVSNGAASFATTGSQFMWRITLTTTDASITPEIAYSDQDGYAIQVIFNLAGPQLNRGCLASPIFDGINIISQVLEEPSRQLFSHWQWARIWATGPMNKTDEATTGTKLWVNIEGSDDGTNFTRIKAGMRLDDLYHGDVDFSDYDGSFDPDEYNFEAEVDPNIIADTVMIEPCTDLSRFKRIQSTGDVPISSTIIAGAELSTSEIDDVVPLWAINNETGYDLSKQQQITFNFYSTGNSLQSDDLEIWLCSEVAEDDSVQNSILEAFEIPRIQSGVTTEIAYNLDKPLELTSVKSIVIANKLNITQGLTLGIGSIKGLATKDYPFYERYLRMRVCMYETTESTQPVMVRQVGVIPVIL